MKRPLMPLPVEVLRGDRWTPNIPEAASESINVLCPAGIGDLYWILGKWQAISKKKDCIFWLPEGEQQRAGALAEMCGIRYGYMPGLTTDWAWSMPGSPPIPEKGWLAVQANRHLENGRNLSDWYPEFPLKYPRITPKFVPMDARGTVVVFMCKRAYMGGNLTPNDWAYIFDYIQRRVGTVRVVAAGDDVEFAIEVGRIFSYPVPPLYDRPLSEVFAHMASSKGVVGVASGLLIMAIIHRIPTYIGYPAHLTKMPGTWEPSQRGWRWCLMKDFRQNIIEDGALKGLIPWKK